MVTDPLSFKFWIMTYHDRLEHESKYICCTTLPEAMGYAKSLHTSNGMQYINGEGFRYTKPHIALRRVEMVTI